MRLQHVPLVSCLLIIGLILPTIVFAQAWVPRKGRLLTWASYQNLDVKDHCFSEDLSDSLGNCVDFGDIRSQSVIFGIDLGIIRNLALAANIAFVAAKYNGASPDVLPLDDGSYNNGFQDFGVSLRYMVLTDPVVITPEIGYGAPTNSYDVLGHSALGRGLQEGRLGLTLGWVPSFLNRAWTQGNYTYAIVEKVELPDGTRIDMNRSSAALALGYFITDAFSARGFGSWRKVHGGLDWLNDLDADNFHAHDQAAATEDGTLGLGLGYSFTPLFAASLSYSWVAWGGNTHNGSSLTIGLNYMFNVYGP